MVLELLRKLNQDCSFTEAIQESEYTESTTTTAAVTAIGSSANPVVQEKTSTKTYKTLVECILSKHDFMYEHIPKEEQKIFLQKLITEMCSSIDEKPDNFWKNYDFNPKCMKSSVVQISFQLSQQQKNTISSLYFLNEYFKHHFVIVRNDKMYETTLKNYPREYILYDEGFSIVEASEQWTKGEDYQLFNVTPITNDLPSLKDYHSVHKMPLQGIGKYKLPELKGLAVEYDISLKKGTKNKVKQELYDEINLYELNHA